MNDISSASTPSFPPRFPTFLPRFPSFLPRFPSFRKARGAYPESSPGNHLEDSGSKAGMTGYLGTGMTKYGEFDD